MPGKKCKGLEYEGGGLRGVRGGRIGNEGKG